MKNNSKIKYQPSAIGSIPTDWTIGKVKDSMSICNNNRTPINAEERSKISGVYPYYGPTKIQDHLDIWNYDGEYVLIAEDGDHFLKYSYLPMTQLASGKFNANNHVHVLKGTSSCLTEWFYWFFNHRNVCRSITLQGVARYKLNKAALGGMLIAIPPIEDQQKIAKILSTWDEAIASTQALIAKLELRKKGLMQQLLTGKKRIPDFENIGDWEELKIRDLLEEINRPLIWDDTKLYHLVSVRRRSGGLFEREPLLGSQILTKKLKPISEDDFLISKMQILHGASCRVPAEFEGKMVSGSYLTLRIKDPLSYSVKFLDYLSRMPLFYHQTYISSYGVHIEKMTFNFKSWKKLKLKFPRMKEQLAICEVLDAADDEIAEQKSKLNELNTQKKGLMQQLLTGKKRVKID